MSVIPEQPKEEMLLFAPKSSRGLMIDYPELRELKAFDNLRPQQLLFVWYYGCKSSPYFNLNWDERDVIKKCFEKSGLIISEPVKKSEFFEGKFPDSIKEAILVMNTFEPAVRMIAKLEAAKILADYRKLTNYILDENGNHKDFLNKDAEIDFNKKAKYQKMLEEKNDALPLLIQRAEQGFGLIEKSKAKIEDKNLDEGGSTFAESYHEHR